MSRVGSSAQIKAMKDVAGTLRLDLNQYRELASFAQFGSDLDKATQDTLNRGEHLTAILKQGERDPLPVEEQVVVLYAASNGYLDDIEPDVVMDWESQFRDYMRDSYGEILESIRDEQKLSDENEESSRVPSRTSTPTTSRTRRASPTSPLMTTKKRTPPSKRTARKRGARVWPPARDLQRQINTVQNQARVFSALQTVSSVKFRKAEARVKKRVPTPTTSSR